MACLFRFQEIVYIKVLSCIIRQCNRFPDFMKFLRYTEVTHDLSFSFSRNFIHET